VLAQDELESMIGFCFPKPTHYKRSNFYSLSSTLLFHFVRLPPCSISTCPSPLSRFFPLTVNASFTKDHFNHTFVCVSVCVCVCERERERERERECADWAGAAVARRIIFRLPCLVLMLCINSTRGRGLFRDFF